MSRTVSPKSLKNLELGRWKPNQSGNPRGRARGHVNPSEYLSGLLALNDDGTPKYREADLETILEDPDEAPAKKLACRHIVTGLKSGERWVCGKDGDLKPAALDPTPLRALESLADRQEGKPTVKIQVEHHPDITPEQMIDDYARMVEKSPEHLLSPIAWPDLLIMLRADRALVKRLRPLLLVHCPSVLEMVEPVDGEAKVLPAGDDEPSVTPA